MIITCPSCSARYPMDAAAFAPSGRKVRCAKCGHSWHQDPPDDLPKKIDLDASAPADSPAETEEDGAAAAAEGAPDDGAAPQDDEDDEVVVFSEAPPTQDGAQDKAQDKASDGDAAGKNAGPGAKPAGKGDTPSKISDGVLNAVGWAALVAFVAGSLLVAYAYRAEIVRLWPATAKLYAALNQPVNLLGMEFKNVAYEHQFENGLPVLAISGEIVNVAGKDMPVPKVRVGLRDGKQRELYYWTFSVTQPALEPMESAAFLTRLSSPPLEARDLEIRFVGNGDDMAEPQGATGGLGEG